MIIPSLTQITYWNICLAISAQFVSKRFLSEITLLFLGSAQKDLPEEAQSELVSALNSQTVSLFS
jgi:hypothetical protein